MTFYIQRNKDGYVTDAIEYMADGYEAIDVIPPLPDGALGGWWKCVNGEFIFDEARFDAIHEVPMLREAKTELDEIRPAISVASAFLAASGNDEVLLQCAPLYPVWESDTGYAEGEVLRHGDGLYRVRQTHTSQAHQPPDGVGMLAVYAPVQAPAPDGEVLPWVSGEAGLKVGDKRSYGGKVYECIQAPGANIWTPDTVPAVWKVVTTNG